ncbi:hypothetical protein BD414DRAFT_92794 [Trametes punicea]|nr:hypothetical protein BD414DRAFT_92794 [Trametes punicea]
MVQSQRAVIQQLYCNRASVGVPIASALCADCSRHCATSMCSRCSKTVQRRALVPSPRICYSPTSRRLDFQASSDSQQRPARDRPSPKPSALDARLRPRSGHYTWPLIGFPPAGWPGGEGWLSRRPSHLCAHISHARPSRQPYRARPSQPRTTILELGFSFPV